MVELTWISIMILGPGAVGIFWWFLKDVKGVLNNLRKQESETSSNAKGRTL